MNYELFATDSANVIGVFDTQEEALDVIRSAIAGSGAGWVEAVVLAELDADGSPTLIAAGSDVVAFALAAEVQRAS